MMQDNAQPISPGDVLRLLANLMVPEPVPPTMDEDGHTADYDCPKCFQDYLDTVDRVFDPYFNDPVKAEGVAVVLLMWGAFRKEAADLLLAGVPATADQHLTQWDAIMQHLMMKDTLTAAGQKVDSELPEDEHG